MILTSAPYLSPGEPPTLARARIAIHADEVAQNFSRTKWPLETKTEAKRESESEEWSALREASVSQRETGRSWTRHIKLGETVTGRGCRLKASISSNGGEPRSTSGAE